MTYFQAEANKLQEAVEQLEFIAKTHHDTIVRVRELVMKALLQQEQNGGQVAIFPSTILQALDGDK